MLLLLFCCSVWLINDDDDDDDELSTLMAVAGVGFSPLCVCLSLFRTISHLGSPNVTHKCSRSPGNPLI